MSWWLSGDDNRRDLSVAGWGPKVTGQTAQFRAGGGGRLPDHHSPYWASRLKD